jgi:hypothetical protein
MLTTRAAKWVVKQIGAGETITHLAAELGFDPDGEVAFAYSVKEAVARFYATSDPQAAADLLRDIIELGSTRSAPAEVRRLAWTLRNWFDPVVGLDDRLNTLWRSPGRCRGRTFPTTCSGLPTVRPWPTWCCWSVGVGSGGRSPSRPASTVPSRTCALNLNPPMDNLIH